ncbi:hypothetical protein IFM58399_07455 [Aspergillus lentulus]|uniref:Uncharacterized protein n=1 Tax=Aspergillus lentulus TaxID=293939 RepID=A0ABQ0ZS91_ASPLE|nr:uncharacterized protein IFM58399_07455 [Aspergillus lentulus]KAF4156617.1 hypothetical protein CNMCM6069_006515 [Aspergillus lentulus]GFF45077.1 hypothetical protein IFM58399_07455 [Aspergillus lentulus]GFF62619.1 hypothetical protein IFM60648_00669 [Aspergillus lentulus]GFF68393.1 hypothetical protein IFM62136_07265 [Aspergillus lentulus]
MDKALVGIILTVDGNVITAPVGAVELEEGSKQLKLSRANKPPSIPIRTASIMEPICLSFPPRPLISTAQFYKTSLEFGGLQDPDVIINHAAAMGTALSPVGTPTVTLRAYRCDQDLVNAYYIFIHPYFPFLPPPIVPQYEDRPVPITVPDAEPSRSCLPSMSSSPLGLAIAAILILVPMPEDANPMSETARKLRRSYAELYARAALAGVEIFLEEYEHMGTAFSSDMDLSRALQSPLQLGLPLPVESVLALTLLAIYEYVQRSNVAKMRPRATKHLQRPCTYPCTQLAPSARTTRTRVVGRGGWRCFWFVSRPF